MADNKEDDVFDMQFVFRTAAERDPSKRKVKPAPQAFMDLGPAEESSSEDSDYNAPSDEMNQDSDAISDSGSESAPNTDESDAEENENDSLSIEERLKKLVGGDDSEDIPKDLPEGLICGVCLGNVSLPEDELIECDGCGVTVHEGCYGISTSGSIGSSVSSCSTEPWFCDCCKAGNFKPRCELCPNEGGVFKETDVGQWVHLVCGLFVPGVAFHDVESLTGITLFEMNYALYGAKVCSLCEDSDLSRTGVCLSCDAGMCKTAFHASCAQRAGLLEFPQEDGNLVAPGEAVDPYIAHCRQHTDKQKSRVKRKSYFALQAVMKSRFNDRTKRNEDARKNKIILSAENDPQRLFRKLTKHRTAYEKAKIGKPPPWVPVEKTPRQLSTCPEAVLRMRHKARLLNLEPDVIEDTVIQQQSIADVRRKWFIPPAFTVEFVAYCLDRGKRISDLKGEVDAMAARKAELSKKAAQAMQKFEEARKRHEEVSKKRDDAHQEAESLYGVVNAVVGETRPTPKCLEPPLPPIRPFFASPVRAANMAKKMSEMIAAPDVYARQGGSKQASTVAKKSTANRKRAESSKLHLLACATCKQTKDQHLVVTCDTCANSYHLACCDPPLTKMPKKTKLYGWQCTRCVEEISSDSEAENVDTEAPRKLRGIVVRPKKYLDGDFAVGALAGGREPDSESAASSHGPHYDSIFEFDGSTDDGESSSTSRPVVKKARREPSGPTSKYVRKSPPATTGGAAAPSSSSASAAPQVAGPSRASSDVFGTPSSAADAAANTVSGDGSADVTPATANDADSISKKASLKPPNKKPRPSGSSLPSTSAAALKNKPAAPTPNGTPGQRLAKRDGSEVRSTSSVGDNPPAKRRRGDRSGGKSSPDLLSRCDVCSGPGTNANLVRCDECKKCYHFGCLDPPLNKTPKVRGYSWHCEDCDNASDNSDGPKFSELKAAPATKKRRTNLRDKFEERLRKAAETPDESKDRTGKWVADSASSDVDDDSGPSNNNTINNGDDDGPSGAVGTSE